MGGASRFWYRNDLPGDRREWTLVDPAAAAATKRPAFATHSTFQVAALDRAGKDCDLYVAPGVGHGVAGTPPGRRRLQDFFARHLLGLSAPERNTATKEPPLCAPKTNQTGTTVSKTAICVGVPRCCPSSGSGSPMPSNATW